MKKSRYYIAKLPTGSMKNPLATLSGHVLGEIDHIRKIFQLHADESSEQTPKWFLYNMIQNSENVFSPRVFDTISCTSPSKDGQSSQESSSFLREKPSCVKTENFENDAQLADGNKATKLWEKVEMLRSSLAKNDKMDIAEDAEIKSNLVEEMEAIPDTEDINVLIRRNLAQISSLSIIGESENIGVEIDIELSYKSKDISTIEVKDSDEMSSPGGSDGKSKSPSTSSSKSTSSVSVPSVDYSDQKIVDFLAWKLSSISSSRKTFVEKVAKSIRNFREDVNYFNNTVDNLNFVVKNLPMADEKYLTDDLLHLRGELRYKADKMSSDVGSLLADVEKDIVVWEECSKEIGIFEKELEPLLSEKDEPVWTVDDLNRLESRLKKMFENVDDSAILEEGRRRSLLNLSSDYEWLLKHFVKFLIITGILEPPACADSEIGKDD